jgi:hypothetical protein
VFSPAIFPNITFIFCISAFIILPFNVAFCQYFFRLWKGRFWTSDLQVNSLGGFSGKTWNPADGLACYSLPPPHMFLMALPLTSSIRMPPKVGKETKETDGRPDYIPCPTENKLRVAMFNNRLAITGLCKRYH